MGNSPERAGIDGERQICDNPPVKKRWIIVLSASFATLLGVWGETNVVHTAESPIPHQVECRSNGKKGKWRTYSAATVDRIPGFCVGTEPETDVYGGWKIPGTDKPTGFFTVRKIGSRWWMIDPLGNLFLAKSVACLTPGRSDRQKKLLKSRFGTLGKWADEEMGFIRETGFNSLGAWSAVETIHGNPNRLPYTVILSPLSVYNRRLREAGAEVEGFVKTDWAGCPYDFPYVFDPEFEKVAEEVLSSAANYADDPRLIGYFLGNEIPWLNSALKTALTKMPADHRNHRVAQEWLDREKGRTGCTVQDITVEDGKKFAAYCHEVYLRKTIRVLRKYDVNHMVLGTRLCRWQHELANEHLLKVAGRYVDVVSLNHYSRWQPEQETMQTWERASGKPFMVTEFYTKGEDSGLPNVTGAGWLVHTQNDRGIFYENFVNELLKSGVCVGWHWFKYMDNDPTDLKADPSNRDSNKGMVAWDYQRYDPLLRHMRQLNGVVYQLVRFHDSNNTGKDSGR